MRGADLIAKTLSKAGIKVIFSLSGNQIMPIYDACIDVGIRLIHTRHEAAAVFMADAYAQLTGQVGVAMVTAAPGFANSLGGLYTARMSESPVVLLTGDSPISGDGKGAFQELDQVSISTPLTKHSLRPRNAQDLGSDLAWAMKIAASGRPGPVHLALPFDLLNADAGDAHVPSTKEFTPEPSYPSDAAIQEIIAAIAAAARPVVLTGPRLNPTRARGLLEQLADALDAPVIPMESPRGLNDPCLGGFSAQLAKADLIVSLGKDIDFTTGFGRPPAFAADCRLMMIDPDSKILERAGRAMDGRLTLAHQADAVEAAGALVRTGSGGGARAGWRSEMTAAIALRPDGPAASATQPMHPATLCAGVQRMLDAADDPILIVDGGEVGQWAQAFITAPTRIINGPAGAIGGCLCYAVGAKVARPDATVVVFMGDGTAGFHFAEFETAHRYGADFIAVIGHDARWNAEYQIQLRDYGPERLNECELDETRYDLAAAGFGCHGELVVDPADLDGALSRAKGSGKTACVVGFIDGLPAPSGVGH